MPGHFRPKILPV